MERWLYIPPELDGVIATNDFPVFEIDITRVVPAYLRLTLFQPIMLRVYEKLSRGSTNRRRLEVDKFLDLEVPLLSLPEQEAFANQITIAEQRVSSLKTSINAVGNELDLVVGSALHGMFETEHKNRVLHLDKTFKGEP